MCGISGFNWRDIKLINLMNKEIAYRGPDSKGIYVDNNISLGHVRLSILDLSKKGNQPMGLKIHKNNKMRLIYDYENLNESDIIIIFNGEVYNFLELREKLHDFLFETRSDTEVVLKSYLKWGFQCVNKFIGMWAFCIHDKRNKILFCSRDRLGQKPFFYYFKNKDFIFSSDLKSILLHQKIFNISKKISKTALELYFAMGFIPAPYTIYEDIKKLSASHNLIFDLKNQDIKRIWRYWDLPNFNPYDNKSYLIDRGKNIFKDSLKLRLRSDVPLGIFLSGGLDSCSVLGGLKEIKSLSNIDTFSIGFKGKTDETNYINLAVDFFKTKHHHSYFKRENFIELLNIYSKIYDEPFADYASFPTIFLSKFTKKYVKVALSGDGGDEIFGGYPIYQAGSMLDILYKFPKNLIKLGVFFTRILNRIFRYEDLDRFRKLLSVSLHKKENFFINFYENRFAPKVFKEWTRNKLKYSLRKGSFRLGEALRIYDILFNTLPDQYLVKIDRASMYYGLEIRSPYLDHRFFEFSQIIPTKLKQNVINTKILMRKMIKELVPKKTVKRKGKYGFTPPLIRWLLKTDYDIQLNEFLIKLDDIVPEFTVFYRKNILNKNIKNEFLINYKIRLFIFYIWWNDWIQKI